MSENDQKPPVSIFYCYAPEDETYREKLVTHLSIMRRFGNIQESSYIDIQAGDVTQDVNESALKQADIVLLLVSPYLLRSDRLYTEQVVPALEQRALGLTRVVPIILRKTDGWEKTPFGGLFALPRKKQPVTAWRDLDDAFADITGDIRALVEALQKEKSSGLPVQVPLEQKIQKSNNGPKSVSVQYEESDIVSALTRLLEDIEDVEITAKHAGLNLAVIKTSPKVYNYWTHVWREACLQQKQLELIRIVRNRYPNDLMINDIYKQFQPESS